MPLTVVTVVGARPNFVKAACFSSAIRRWNRRAPSPQRLREVLVHTGQHYDPNLSRVFFDTLPLRTPDYALRVRESHPVRQVARMAARLEPVLKRERPDAVVVYGDTNSTLAGAVAAERLGFPVAHIEAGLRSFNPDMAEERNRIVVDHLATWCFCPTATAAIQLHHEGAHGAVIRSGDLMVELLRDVMASARPRAVLKRLGLTPRKYLVLTVHRAENTDTAASLTRVLQTVRRLLAQGWIIVVPVHPRLRDALRRFRFSWPSHANLRCTDPLPYVEMLALISTARAVLTDSGGLQKEAVWLGLPCLTLRKETEWVETLRGGRNQLVGADPGRICAAVQRLPAPGASLVLRRGAPRPSDRIVARLARDLSREQDRSARLRCELRCQTQAGRRMKERFPERHADGRLRQPQGLRGQQ